MTNDFLPRLSLASDDYRRRYSGIASAGLLPADAWGEFVLFISRIAAGFTQNMNRACSWNIRGGSMFANAGIAFVAVPTPPTNWPNVAAGVAASPYVVTPRPRKFP